MGRRWNKKRNNNNKPKKNRDGAGKHGGKDYVKTIVDNVQLVA